MKNFRGFKTGLTRAALVLLVLSMLTFAAAMAPSVNAGETAVAVSPTQGPVGTSVYVTGAGFTGQVIVRMGNTQVLSLYGGSMFGSITGSFKVPSVSTGTYTITAEDEAGHSVTATFTVTSTATAAPTPTSQTSTSPGTSGSPSSSTSPGSTYYPENTYSYPTGNSSPNPKEGGVDLTLILIVFGVVAAVVVVSLLVVFLLRRGGGNKYDRFPEETPAPSYKPSPYVPPATRPSSNPYARPSTSTATSSSYRFNRFGGSSSRPTYGSHSLSRPPTATRSTLPGAGSRMSSYTRLCPNCKRVVRDDYNRCPYCDKKLR